MEFAAVEFEEKSCVVVPVTWILNNVSCYWPNSFVNQKQFRHMIETFSPPLPKWNVHPIKRIFFTCGILEDAERRLNEIIEHSTNSENGETNKPLYLKEFQEDNEQSFTITTINKDREIERTTFSSEDDIHLSDIQNKTMIPSKRNNKTQHKNGATKKRNASPEKNCNSSSPEEDRVSSQENDLEPLSKKSKLSRNKNSKRLTHCTSSSDDDIVYEKIIKRNPLTNRNRINVQSSYGTSTPNSRDFASPRFINSNILDDQDGSPLTACNTAQLSASLMARMSPANSQNNDRPLSSTSRSTFISRTSSPATTQNMSDHAFKEKTVVCLEKIIAVLDQHSIQITEITRVLNSKSTTSLTRPEDFPNLPLEKKGDFEHLERLLTNHTEAYNFLKNRLACLGGNAVRGATMNMIKFVFSDRLGRKFNWAGNNGKIPFKCSKLLEVIKEAVYLAFSTSDSRISDLNDTTIATALKDWLRLANQRYGYKRNPQ